MKKTISILLSILMIFSVVSSMNLTAFAATDTIVISKDMGQYDDTYQNDTKIKKVIIEDGVLNFMTPNAFKGCTNLTDVVIGKDVGYVPLSAFQGCTNLTNLTISGDTDISDSAFYGCKNIKKITYTGHSLTSRHSQSEQLKDQPWYVSKDSLETVILNEGITSVNSVLTNCSKLKTVSFPSTIDTITSSFNNCSMLTDINLPTVTTISNSFSDCSVLTSVTIDTYTLDGNSFSNCENLKEVTFNRIFSLDGRCFHNDNSLKEFKVSSAVKDFSVIDGNLVWKKTTLKRYAPGKIDKSYTIPAEITSIGDYAFSGTPYIQNVTFNLTVNQIRTGAFVNCPNIKNVTIPATVSYIGDHAFGYNCIFNSTTYEKSTPVTIKSSSGTSAETYANDNNLPFVALCTDGHNYVYLDKTYKHQCSTCGVVLYEGHSYDSGIVTKKATCSEEGIKTYTCKYCNATRTEAISKIPHNFDWNNGEINKDATCSEYGQICYSCTQCGEKRTCATPMSEHIYKTTTTKATTSKNGSVVTKCSVCGTVLSTTTIAYPKTITLSASSYVYNGSARKPSVTVKDSANKVVAASNYTVSYNNNTNVGTATVKITFKSNYSGTINKTFTIVPTTTTITNLTANYKGFTVNWNKQTTQTTGYQIQYATKSDFSNAATVYGGNTKATSKKITGRAANTKYYVRVRTYKNIDGTYFYSSWSDSKTVTTTNYPTNITLSSSSYTYDGKVKQPGVTVKDNNGNKLSSKYYTVSYQSGRKNVGTYKVTIKFKNGYSGTTTKTFKIVPKSTSVSKVTAKSKGFTVQWNKQTAQTTGYQIQYATKSDFSNAATVYGGDTKATSKTITGRAANTKYYVRVRTYKNINGTYYYSAWSNAKTVTTKK